MTYDEYQKAAHSTAVYGNNNSYPFMALTEETSEVLNVWIDHIDDIRTLGSIPDDIRAKFCDEIGDVCWNVAELMTILNMKMSEHSDVLVTHEPDQEWLYWLHRFTIRVGAIAGAYAKWTRKHDGVQATNEEIINQTDIPKRLSALWSEVRILIKVVGLTEDEVLQHNIDKLAKRRANNTLGGAGSVERKE